MCKVKIEIYLCPYVKYVFDCADLHASEMYSLITDDRFWVDGQTRGIHRRRCAGHMIHVLLHQIL